MIVTATSAANSRRLFLGPMLCARRCGVTLGFMGISRVGPCGTDLAVNAASVERQSGMAQNHPGSAKSGEATCSPSCR